MQPPLITKFGFRIRTLSGLIVDHLMIHGRDVSEAERKLRQMYPGCEILECVCHQESPRTSASSYEDIISLITR